MAFHHATLDNGLQVIAELNDQAYSVASGFFVKTGSRDEAPEVEMLLQVHDELLLEGPEAELRRIAPRIGEIMEGALELRAPLHVDLKLGVNWEDMRTLSLASLASPTRA